MGTAGEPQHPQALGCQLLMLLQPPLALLLLQGADASARHPAIAEAEDHLRSPLADQQLPRSPRGLSQGPLQRPGGIVDPDRHTNRIMAQMKKDLRMPVEPRHIEGFDNSNIQGTNPVAACVVFKNGKPSKKDYRKFNIKTVEGPNDFASMEEVVFRRYRRLLNEEQDLPQLIVIDGGKGQLSSAVKALEALDLRGKIAIIGIAKRLEEIYYPGDSIPLYLDKKSETLKVIQQLRNEAHRFGITFHRNKRSKTALNTELESIAGIGEKTVVELLKHFRSLKRIKEASEKDLAGVVGSSRASIIYQFYQSEK